MKLLIIISLLFFQSAFSYEISPELLFERPPFESHRGEGEFDSYLSLPLKYEPVAKIYRELEKNLNKKLITRGEAHITVITPVEFYQVLRSKLRIDEIEKIAIDAEFQKAKFNLVCLGKGEKDGDETFYIVVESKEILNVRRKIHEAYVKAGGEEDAFKPEHYYPHITVGFTRRDLHESDGIIKDKSSCFDKISIK